MLPLLPKKRKRGEKWDLSLEMQTRRRRKKEEKKRRRKQAPQRQGQVGPGEVPEGEVEVVAEGGAGEEGVDKRAMVENG